MNEKEIDFEIENKFNFLPHRLHVRSKPKKNDFLKLVDSLWKKTASMLSILFSFILNLSLLVALVHILTSMFNIDPVSITNSQSAEKILHCINEKKISQVEGEGLGRTGIMVLGPSIVFQRNIGFQAECLREFNTDEQTTPEKLLGLPADSK